jgi:hypothetical protein
MRRQAKNRRKVHGNQFVPEFLGIFRGGSSTDHSCIVHEDVDRTELRDGSCNERTGYLGIRQISRNVKRLTARCEDFAARRAGIGIPFVGTDVSPDIRHGHRNGRRAPGATPSPARSYRSIGFEIHRFNSLPFVRA